MDASRKRARTGSTSAEDRLSALPDALIHTIMSFLKAHQVVQTCVLAKRWTHLWRSVPNLDIDLPEFNCKINKDDRATIVARYEKFVDFADYLLVHRHQDGTFLDTFRLQVDSRHQLRPEDAGRWVRRGLKCSPRVLHVQNVLNYGYKYNTVPLELWSGPPSSCRLTKLHLCGVLLNCSFTEQISSVCDVLEEMELKSCEIKFQKITSPSLKCLIIHRCYARCESKLIITAPHLASLHLNICEDYGFKVLVLNEMLSLVKASIYSGISSPGDVVLLSSLSNVTSLELLGFHKQV
uniref:Uncharacterized protein n=1 Tax=Avena sativa TaxID=4498 RepID=A0ACD5UAH1_AVESA